MSYKDNDFLLFPTRHGPTIGTSRERTMLDNCGGAGGIVRRVRENPDGSTTLLRTRAGNPEFLTDETGIAKICWHAGADVDSGFVDTTYNFNGMDDETDGKLFNVADITGALRTDVKIKDTHAWKETFGDGAAMSSTTGDTTLYWGLPSNFSGLMRRLMQVQHGTTTVKQKVPYEVPAGTECPVISTPDPFSCRYVKTHGMFIATTGKRWVIEVSSEGVFRIPIDFVSEFTTDNVYAFEQTRMAALGNYADFVTEMINYWTITKFKHSDKFKIADAPASYAEGYSPWYPWCGWAFDYKGRKATVALSRQHPSEASWYQAALYDMTITETDGGIPAYVTVAKSGEGPLATSINDYDDNSNAFIQCAVGHPGVCSTIGLFSPVSVGSTVNAPIFSFYEETGVKQVYYFDTYASTPVNSTTTNDPVSTVTVSRTGSWVVGNFLIGETYEYPGDGVYAEQSPYSYPVSVRTNTGTTSETLVGTYGGWGGFSGEALPTQNDDYTGTRSYIERIPSGAGWCFMPVIKNAHVSRVTGVYQNGTQQDNADLLPYLYQSYDVKCSATGMIPVSGTAHSKVLSHRSTFVMAGYDRESMVFAHTTSTFTGAHSRSGSLPSENVTVQIQSLPLARRPPALYEALNAGVPDWCLYISLDNGIGYGPFLPSQITGWFDASPLMEKILTVGRLYADADMTTFMSDSVSESAPETTTGTSTYYMRVGGQNKIFSFANGDIHRTYYDTNVFRFWIGASAFGGRGTTGIFYSKEITEKPTVEGVGAYPQGLKSLWGFIGVF